MPTKIIRIDMTKIVHTNKGKSPFWREYDAQKAKSAIATRDYSYMLC